MPSETVVNKARVRSKEVVDSYLLHQAQDVYESHSLIPMAAKKKKKKKKIRTVTSETDLRALKKKKEKKKKKKKHQTHDGGYKTETSATSGTTSESDWDQESLGEVGSPVYYILSELRKIAPEGKAPRSCPAFDLHGIFEEWTEERKAAYGKDLIAAIRARDIDQLRAWHEEGRTLQAANRFGESVLHLACRRGFLDVVKFLTEEANVSLWIRDDTGRTPLHDACWTPQPCYELVDFILSKEKDMLFVSDKRGHTPLDYARKDSWDAWIGHFMEKDMSELLPERSNFYLIKQVKPAAALHGENKILENVDDMIIQLAISTQGADSSRHSSDVSGVENNTASENENADDKSADSRSRRSQKSNTSASRRRRIRQQREKEIAESDGDEDSVNSGSKKSHRGRRPRGNSAMGGTSVSWRVIDVKVTHQDSK